MYVCHYDRHLLPLTSSLKLKVVSFVLFLLFYSSFGRPPAGGALSYRLGALCLKTALMHHIMVEVSFCGLLTPTKQTEEEKSI